MNPWHENIVAVTVSLRKNCIILAYCFGETPRDCWQKHLISNKNGKSPGETPAAKHPGVGLTW